MSTFNASKSRGQGQKQKQGRGGAVQKQTNTNKKDSTSKPRQRDLTWVTILSDEKQKDLMAIIVGKLEKSRGELEKDFKQYRTEIGDLPSPAAREASQSCENCGVWKSIVVEIPVRQCDEHPLSWRDHDDESLCNKCGQNIYKKMGCLRRPVHEFSMAPIPPGVFVAPTAETTKPRRAIVVLDLEFCQIVWKDKSRLRSQVPSSIGMVDGLTGEILLNAFIAQPWDEDILFLDYKRSGMTSDDVKEAKAAGTAFRSLEHLNEAMNRFIDSNTIVCGHGVHGDLKGMRLGVDRILDTALLEHVKGQQAVGLKTLVNTKLPAGKIPGFQDDKFGHDALEDAYATREVLLAIVFARVESERFTKPLHSVAQLATSYAWLELTTVPTIQPATYSSWDDDQEW